MIALKNRSLKVGQSVEVYYNLHKDIFSIRDKKTKLVLAYADTVYLKDVTFKVNQKLREKTIETKRKRVHAFVVGQFLNAEEITFDISKSKSAYYNPYITKTFIDFDTKEPLTNASIAYCENKRVFYQP